MTVSEIAEEAGVSTGTVDRVLHNRGGVSAKTKAKIQAIIEKNGYHPNFIARQLKNNKTYKLGVLLPDLKTGCGYYSALYKGMVTAKETLEPFNFELILKEYDRTKSLDCFKKGTDLVKAGIDGLITSPLVPNEFFELTPLLTNIPYVFVDSPLNITGPLCTIAQNPYKSGYCAGRIMKLLRGSGTFACLKMNNNAYNLNERYRGFKDYIHSDSGSKVIDATCTDFTEIGIYSYLESLFLEHKDINGIFVPHAEVLMATYYLANKGLKDKVTLIGFDSVEQNKKALLDGTIDCLIGQRPEIQGFEAVQKLYHNLMLHKDVPDTLEIPIDIYFRENI